MLISTAAAKIKKRNADLKEHLNRMTSCSLPKQIIPHCSREKEDVGGPRNRWG